MEGGDVAGDVRFHRPNTIPMMAARAPRLHWKPGRSHHHVGPRWRRRGLAFGGDVTGGDDGGDLDLPASWMSTSRWSPAEMMVEVETIGDVVLVQVETIAAGRWRRSTTWTTWWTRCRWRQCCETARRPRMRSKGRWPETSHHPNRVVNRDPERIWLADSASTGSPSMRKSHLARNSAQDRPSRAIAGE